MTDQLVKILDGDTCVVSDSLGDIEASATDPAGLFAFGTRFLSRWKLSVNGRPLDVLSVDDLQYFEARFFLVPRTGTVHLDSTLSVIRRRSVSRGFVEMLTIVNHDGKKVPLDVRIDAASDFAVPAKLRDAPDSKGRYHRSVQGGSLVLGYRAETLSRETRISSSAGGRVDDEGVTFDVTVEPHGRWTATLHVDVEGTAVSLAGGGRGGAHHSEAAADSLEAGWRRHPVDIPGRRVRTDALARWRALARPRTAVHRKAG